MNIYYAHFIHYQKSVKRIQKGAKRYIKDVPEIKKDNRRVVISVKLKINKYWFNIVTILVSVR